MQVGVFYTGNLKEICCVKRHGKSHRGYIKNFKANGIGMKRSPTGSPALENGRKTF
jgi:hypothetical protein